MMKIVILIIGFFLGVGTGNGQIIRDVAPVLEIIDMAPLLLDLIFFPFVWTFTDDNWISVLIGGGMILSFVGWYCIFSVVFGLLELVIISCLDRQRR